MVQNDRKVKKVQITFYTYFWQLISSLTFKEKGHNGNSDKINQFFVPAEVRKNGCLSQTTYVNIEKTMVLFYQLYYKKFLSKLYVSLFSSNFPM